MSKIQEPFLSYAHYLKERYHKRVYRVAVDAGFSCPVRGKDREQGGCLFCGGRGSRAPYLKDLAIKGSPGKEGLKEQVKKSIAFLRQRYQAEAFILYFQAFSNTYAPAPILKEIYDAGLAAGDFLELVVSTRPDCLDETKVRLLASYRTPERDVWVELGLQSFHEESLKRIRRGHSIADFLKAYQLLKEAGLKVSVHLIYGLPGESRTEIIETVSKLSQLRPDGVKIHNLHIVKGTELAKMWQRGEVKVLTAQQHLELLCETLELLPPQTVIMRLTCDTPAEELLAPLDFPPKAAFLRLLKEEMQKRESFQGKKWLAKP